MKYLAVFLLSLMPCMAAAAEPDAASVPQIKQAFASGGYIRLQLSPGGYTITNADANEIQVTYQSSNPDQFKKVKVKIQTSALSADVSVSDTPHNNFHATMKSQAVPTSASACSPARWSSSGGTSSSG